MNLIRGSGWPLRISLRKWSLNLEPVIEAVNLGLEMIRNYEQKRDEKAPGQ